MSIVLFSVLIWQVVDFLRELTNLKTQKSAVITQITAWAGGILLVAIGAHSAVTSGLVFPGTDKMLGHLDAGSTVLLGMMAASLASSLVDTKQALDGADSASKPPLVPSAPSVPPAV